MIQFKKYDTCDIVFKYDLAYTIIIQYKPPYPMKYLIYTVISYSRKCMIILNRYKYDQKLMKNMITVFKKNYTTRIKIIKMKQIKDKEHE